MDRVRERLALLVHRGAAEAGVEVYHWELRRRGSQTQVAVQVDRPGGITLDDCARASRSISHLLDKDDPLSSPYLLEVSSPGVERELREPRHYAQSVGRLARLVLHGQGVREGRLSRVVEDGIILEGEGEEVPVAFSSICGARLVYEQGRR